MKKFSDNMVGVSCESISQAVEWLKEELEQDKPPDHSFDNGGIVKSSSTGGLLPVERDSKVTTGPIGSLSERGTSPVPYLQDTGTFTGPIMADTGISTLPEVKEVATITS